MIIVTANCEPFIFTKVGFNDFVLVILSEKLVNFEVTATLEYSKTLHPLLTYFCIHFVCICGAVDVKACHWKNQSRFSFR